jgi:ABC-type hemin transport system ATPase subunit
VLTRDLLARVYGESVRLLQVPGTGLPVVLPAI